MQIEHISSDARFKEAHERLAKLAARRDELRRQLGAEQRAEAERAEERRRRSTAEALAGGGEFDDDAPSRPWPFERELKATTEAVDLVGREIERLESTLSVEACKKAFHDHRRAVLRMRDAFLSYREAVDQVRQIEHDIEAAGFRLREPITQFFPPGAKPGESADWFIRELESRGYKDTETEMAQ